jgi:hypothetical protein
MYQGGLPETYDISDFGSFLREGVNVIAIQGHNSSPGSSDFSLIPMLTLGLGGAGYTDNHPDYIQLSGRQLHTNFKISNKGETLILSRPDSSLVDSVSPVQLPTNISYGRKPDGENSWFYFTASTPGASNLTWGYSSLTGDTVKFSFMGGYFPGGLELRLSCENPLDTIVFTLDGSEPTINDSLYKYPILVSKNTVVRARALNSQILPGVITTNTYFTKQHSLPVVCLSTDPPNLWDYNTGIYVKGPNASADSPFFGANFWQDWERKAHMELYDIDGNKQIDQEIGIKIFGSYSRANDQRSMALYARKVYGKGSFEYQFFKDKPINKFEAIILRNGGNDWGSAIIRDGLTSSLIRNMDIDRMAFQPAIIYINGEYWGILNIREKINANYLAENQPVNPDNVNLLEWNASIIQGSNESYLSLLSLLNKDTTLVSEQNYLPVSEKIDINSYIQYQLTQIYINNKDWPGNNIKYWNTNDPGSKWRWIIYDTDFGFSIWEEAAYNYNTLKFALDPAGPDWPNPPWATLLFRRMMSNPAFRNEFINQYADRLNTNFAATRVNAVIDSLKQLYLPEINDHMVRWGLSYDYWMYNFTIIKNYAAMRPTWARIHMQSELGLNVRINITVEVAPYGSGSVKVNSVIPESYPFTGIYFKDMPIKLTAIPAPGYKFVRWEGTVNSDSSTIDYNMSATGTFRAVFGYNIVINEINYNSSPEKDSKDWVELYNAGNTPVNLRNWIISDKGPEVGYRFSSDIVLVPGMYMVVCREMASFRLFNPKVLNITGDMNFGLGSTGDDVNLYDAEGTLVDFVNFTPNAPWPTDANGTGASIELIDPLADNNDGSKWKSSADGGTPGTLNMWTLPLGNKEICIASGCKLDCFPNPFTDYTTLRIEAPAAGKYRLEVYDLQGRLLNILADQVIDSGAYYMDWDGRDQNNKMLPGGIYFVRLSGEKASLNLKVVILK